MNPISSEDTPATNLDRSKARQRSGSNQNNKYMSLLSGIPAKGKSCKLSEKGSIYSLLRMSSDTLDPASESHK